MEQLSNDYKFLLNTNTYKAKVYQIIESRIWYLKNTIGFNFSEEEICSAEKRNDGFIGIKNNCKCYLRKLL